MDSKNSFDDGLLRRLSPREAFLYRETQQKSMIMVGTTLFESGVDLFEHLSKIDEAIQLWKSLHPMLRCTVVDKPNENPELPADLYFAFASEEKINGLDNVTYLRVDAQTIDNDYWRLLHDRASYIEPVGSNHNLLWRLILLKLNDNEYSITLTLNHIISDGLNSLPLVDQLLTFIDQLIDGSLDRLKLSPFELNPSMEEEVLKKAASIPLDSIKMASLPTESRIPVSLQPKPARSAPTHFPADDKLIDVKTNECLFVRDLIVADNSQYFSKIRPFSIDEETVRKLLTKCKSTNAKLTGCLTIINALAVRDMYKHASCGEDANNIYVRLLASPRITENINNLNMGYWVNIMNVVVTLANVNIDDDQFYRTKFWEMCKHETDSLHERIKSSEMLHNLLAFNAMAKKTENSRLQLARGAGVHFSLSNKGTFEQSKMNHIKITHCYSNSSCPENRMGAAMFYGMYTINKQLSWSIGYNANIISDVNIEYLVGSILRIIQNVIDT